MHYRGSYKKSYTNFKNAWIMDNLWLIQWGQSNAS